MNTRHDHSDHTDTHSPTHSFIHPPHIRPFIDIFIQQSTDFFIYTILYDCTVCLATHIFGEPLISSFIHLLNSMPTHDGWLYCCRSYLLMCPRFLPCSVICISMCPNFGFHNLHLPLIGVLMFNARIKCECFLISMSLFRTVLFHL